MPNNNDLSILIKILLEQSSKTNLTTEINKLIKNINEKLSITPNIKLPTTKNVSEIVQKINKLLSSRIETNVNLKNVNLNSLRLNLDSSHLIQQIHNILQQQNRLNIDTAYLNQQIQTAFNNIRVNVGNGNNQNNTQGSNRSNNQNNNINPTMNYDYQRTTYNANGSPTRVVTQHDTQIGQSLQTLQRAGHETTNTITQNNRAIVALENNLNSLRQKATNTLQYLQQKHGINLDLSNVTNAVNRINSLQLDVNNLNLPNNMKEYNQQLQNSIKLLGLEDAELKKIISNLTKQENLQTRINTWKSGLNNGITSNATKFSNFDTSELNNIRQRINEINILTPNAVNKIKELNQEYKNIVNNLKLASQTQLNTERIEQQIKKINNELTRLKVNKDKVFEDTRVSSEVNTLKQMETQFRNGQISARQYASQMDNLRTRVAQVSGELRNVNKDGYSFTSMVELAAKKIMIWAISTNLVYGSLRQLQLGISYISALDNSLNEIRIVTNKTQQEVNNLALSYNELAKQMSVTTKEIASVSADLYRQGLNDTDVETRMKSIIQYAKISSMSLKDSNKIITATANATGESVQKIIDIFAALGDTTAADASEIGEALMRVASAAENSSVSLEKTSSWLATISSITRESPSTIGRSLNSVIARYESIKKTGFNQEDETKINDVVQALSDIGIKATDSQGQLIDFAKVMDLVGAKFNQLSKNEKSYIATAMFGTYQRNRGLTLLNNYQLSLKNYENAMNSAGASEQKFSIYQQSTAARLDELRASWEGLWQSIINSSIIKGTIDSFSFLINSLGNLPTIIGFATSALLLWKGSLLLSTNAQNLFVGMFPVLIANINTFSASLTGLTAKQVIATIATRTFSTALNSLKLAFMSNPIGLIVTGLTTAYIAFELVSQKLTKHTKELREEFTKLKDELKSVKSEITQTENLLKTYESLSGGIAKTTEEKESLANATQKLSELYPEAISKYDLEGKAVETNIKLIKELLAVKKQEADEKKNELKNKFIDTSEDDYNNLISNKKKIENANKELNDLLNLRNNRSKFSNATLAVSEFLLFGDTEEEKISTLREKIRKLTEESRQDFDNLSIGAQSFYSELDNFKSLDQSNLSLFLRDILNNTKELNNIDINEFIEQLGNAKVPDIFAEYNKALEEYNKSPKNKDDYTNLINKQKTAIDNLTKAFDDLDKKAPDTLKKLKEDFLAIPDFKEIEDKVVSFTQYQEQLGSSFESTSKEIATLNDALDEYNENGEISSKTIMQLLKDYPQLISALTTENGIMKLNTDAIKNLAKEKEKEFKKTLELRNKDLKAQEDALTKKLEGYNLEIKKLRELRKENEVSYAVELFQNAERKFGTQLSETKQRYEDAKKSGNKNEEIKALQELDKINTVDKLNYLQEITDSLNKLDDVTNSIKLNDATIGLDFDALSKEGKGKSDKETNPVTNLISKYTVEQEKIDALIEKSKAIQETLIPSSVSLRYSAEEGISVSCIAFDFSNSASIFSCSIVYFEIRFVTGFVSLSDSPLPSLLKASKSKPTIESFNFID